MILVNIEIKAQKQFTSIPFVMAPTPITPIVSPNKSHKKIKFLRRPKQTICSISTTNDDLTNNEPNELNPSVTIHASPATPSKSYIRHTKLTHCINHIAKDCNRSIYCISMQYIAIY